MKKIYSSILITIMVYSFAYSQSSIEKIQDLIKQKRYIAAIDECRLYLQKNKKDEKGWVLLAQSFLLNGDIDSAEVAAIKVIDIEDSMFDGYVTLAQVQIAKNKFVEAGNTARKGLSFVKKKQPKYPPLLVVLAQAQFAMDSINSALISASEAYALDPNNSLASEIMGDVYAKQNVGLMAIQSYNNSIRIDSTQTNVLYKLANVYYKEKKYSDAARVYESILLLDPNNDVARIELADLYYKAKMFSSSAKTFEDYFKKEKNPPKDLQLKYLEALLGSGKYKEAFELGQAYLKADSTSTIAYRAIANGYYAEKQYNKAIETFKKIESFDTLKYDDYKLMGGAYKQLKKYDLAALAWMEVIKDTTIESRYLPYYYDQIAGVWMSAQNYEKAAEYYGRRIELDSTAAGAYINYAVCLTRLERHEDAIKALKNSLKINPSYPTTHVNLGFSYMSLKEYDAARKEFETAIKLVDTMEFKHRLELADSYRMIGTIIMMEKKATSEESQKKYEDAILYLKKSIKYRDDFGMTYQLLGQAHQNLGKKEDAIKYYKQALKLDPKLEDSKKGLKMLTE